MVYVIRSKSGLTFTSCDDDSSYGEEIEYGIYEEALDGLRVYEKTFREQEFYIKELR